MEGLNLSELNKFGSIQVGRSILLESDPGSVGSYTFSYGSLYEIANLLPNASLRRNIYRGSNIGSAVTDEQWEEIRTGRFNNMFIGDYWSIGGYNWQIVDMDYYLTTGSETAISAHHLLIMPTQPLYEFKYSNDAVPATGYYSSYIRSNGLSNAAAIIKSAFGLSHLMQFPIFISNSSNNTGEVGWIWTTGMIELPTASMLGLVHPDGKEHGCTDYLPLAITNLNLRAARFCRKTYWTRNITKGGMIITQFKSGASADSEANQTDIWVRPVFAII